MPRNSRLSVPRETLRAKGQFWTPAWIAEAMVEYVVSDGGDSIFDPAVGEGAFFRAAKSFAKEANGAIRLSGTEIDPEAVKQSLQNGLVEDDISRVQIRDFVLAPPRGPFRSIVANPPYIRHHRLSPEVKVGLRALASELIGAPLDGRAGLHIYFLLRALQLLDRGGRLAFIMPADTCEGVFAPMLWHWITRRFQLEAVVTFDPAASPFPEVDTNPVIFMIRNTPPKQTFWWVKCHRSGTSDLKAWLRAKCGETLGDALTVHQRDLSEALATGLSRPPAKQGHRGPTLGDFAAVMRGIATGANEFFFLTTERARELKLPAEFLVPAVGRTRDVCGNQITHETLDMLRAKGRPTLLLSLDGRPVEQFPDVVRDYLKRGEELGFPRRPLIATRQPWYKMETRTPPPILFAYLGRRNARFVRNEATVLPLTGFLCVYPRHDTPEFIAKLWEVLCDPRTAANLPLVGKSYGSGAIKVEPRALEKLPLPQELLSAAGLLCWQKASQQTFPFACHPG